MSDETGEVAGGEPIAVIEAPADTGTDLSVSEAGRALNAARNRKPPAESAEVATAEPELSGEDNAAPAEQATGETQEADPAEKPPLELPRSWTKDRAEHWAKLDPGTQEFLLEQDRKASAEVRRVQNEAAEKLKGLTAREQEVEQEKKTYQDKLPALMQALLDVSDREFPDIKSIQDYERLSMEALRLSSGDNADPFRALQIQSYLQAFNAHQQKLQATNAELQRANSEKQSAAQTELDTYKNEQDKLFHEFAPELAEPKKKAEIIDKAVKALVDELGFKRSELDEFAANPTAARLLFHHAFQKLVYNHLKLSDLKAAPKAVARSDLPPVVRPGTAKPPGNAVSEQIQALTQKLNETGDLKIAQQLRALQVQRRAS
jgi:hypothetical protein